MGNVNCLCLEEVHRAGSQASIADKMEAYLWANLTYLSERVSSPEEKERIAQASNGALQSLRDFQAGPAYALVGSVTDADGSQVPFVCFRGLETFRDDAVRKVLSYIDLRDFVTTKGSTAGKAEVEYVGQYEALKDLGLVRWAAEAAKLCEQGIIIAGHGVGGALANLLAVELLIDSGFEISKIRLRTFGTPRVFCVHTVASIKKLELYKKMSFVRFINDDDIYPSLPPIDCGLLHLGIAVKYSKTSNEWYYGECEDVTIRQDHHLMPHLLQGRMGYIQNLHKTIKSSENLTLLQSALAENDEVIDETIETAIPGHLQIYPKVEKRDGHMQKKIYDEEPTSLELLRREETF